MPIFDPQTQTFPEPHVHISPKRDRFCLEWVKDYNATKAAERAGYSPKSAYAQGHALLKLPEVQERIEELQDHIREQSFIEVMDIEQELAKIAFANAEDFFEWSESGVTLKDSNEISSYKKAAVKAVRETKTQHGGSIALEFHNKEKALELLGLQKGMFTGKDKGKGSVREDFESKVQEGARRFDEAELDPNQIH